MGLMRTIEEILNDDCLSPKVLLTSNVNQGVTLLKELANNGTKVCNVVPTTIYRLASYIVQEKSISSIHNRLIMRDVLFELKKSHKLKYFNKINLSSGIIKNILSSINELIANGATIHDEDFENKEKANDIRLIMNLYLNVLNEKKYIPEASYVCIKAIDKAKPINSKLIIDSNLWLNYYEEELVHKLFGNNIEKFVMTINEKINLKNIELFATYGSYAEAKEVLRQVVSNKINLDEVAVYVTTPDEYSQHFYDLVSKYPNFEVTFGSGISIKNSKVYKVVASIDEQSEEKVIFGDYVDEIMNKLSEYSEQNELSEQIEIEANEKIVRVLNELKEYEAEKVMTKVEAYKNIISELLLLKVNASKPKPQAIHIDKFTEGIYLRRRYNFLLGFTSDKYPGKVVEDPIILDNERMRINQNQHCKKQLEIKAEYVDIAINKMKILQSLFNDTLIASYPMYTTTQVKKNFPANILLDLYRIQQNDTSKSYSDLEKNINKITLSNAKSPIDSMDYWLNQIFENKKVITMNLLNSYDNLTDGIKTNEMRNSNKFTEADGKIDIDIKNDTIYTSVSALEKLGKCPFMYFLENILKIECKEEPNENEWLDKKEKGTLLHKVFEMCYKTKKDRQMTKDFLYEIADEIIDEKLLEKPTSNLSLVEKNKQEIYGCCDIFLRTEALNDIVREPIEFEYNFKTSIKVPSGGTFKISGIVDRIDKLKNTQNQYIIIDYKTGSSYAYNFGNYVNGGRQLQHLIYAIAVENDFSKKGVKSPMVKKAEYLFVSPSENGKKYVRIQEGKDKLRILDELWQVIKNGVFPMNCDTDSCGHCKYSIICTPRTIKKEKMYDTVEGLKDLQNYRDEV